MIEGATLTVKPEGVELRLGWMFTRQIATVDALKIRDWLNENYPKGSCKCQPK